MIDISDKAKSVAERIEAIRNLASQCREPPLLSARALKSLGNLIDPNLGYYFDDERVARNDQVVRREAVRALGNWGRDPVSLNVLVGALSIPGLRSTVVETLDQIGPATGPVQARLIAELNSLRADPGKRHLMTQFLPRGYGRDPLVIGYLKDLQKSGNRWDRALASSELCGLGELETALQSAHDPEPRVRKSLAVALGWYRESGGTEVLEQLLHDDDPRVALEAAKALRLLGKNVDLAALHALEARGGGRSWGALLKELSLFRLTDPKAAAAAGERRRKAGWLGEPGASEQQLEAAEQRLGRRLPPSYRAFLAESNGFEQPNSSIPKLYSAADIEWFRVTNADWIKAYEVGDERFWPKYLRSCLQISAVGDGAVLLLNPETETSDGEWETLFFANFVPGATAYRSFREYMEEQLNGACEWRNRSLPLKTK